MNNDIQFFNHPLPFLLESGLPLKNLQIAYHTYGTLNPQKSNVIWICHALTANSHVAEWWPGLVGSGKPFDTNKYFVICANILGSCYGTTASGLFPENEIPAFITIRDMVQAHILLRKHIGIQHIHLLVGGSMGGYQALEWCIMEPAIILSQLLLVTSAAETAWGIAIHTAQRLAIEADDTWLKPVGGAKGLKAARAFGMITYRSYKQFVNTQKDDAEKVDNFKATSYINHQGDKLVSRFFAKAYWLLTKAMDSHNISRGRGGHLSQTLETLLQPTTIIGINSDLLSPTPEQQLLAAYLPNSKLHIIDSLYGHDGFLTEVEKISKIIFSTLQ